MADDRIYMQCNICGKKLYLGKQFGWEPFFWANYGKMNGDVTSPPLEDRLNKFFADHYHPDADVCRWNGNFSIVYEAGSPADFDAVWGSPFKRDEECEDCKGIKGFCEGDREG